MIKNIDFKLIEYPKGWDLIADDWLKLFNQCDQPCVFYHPLFLEAAKVLPAHIAPSHIILGYQDQIPVFGLPIILKKCWGLLNQINFFNGGDFDHLAALDSTIGCTATENFFSYIKDNFRPAVIQGGGLANQYKNLLEKICTENQFKIFIRPFFRCPYIALPNNQEELMNNFTKNLRHSLRNHLKRAEKAGIEFRIITSSNQEYNFTDAFQNLLIMHDARFKSLDRSSKFIESTSKDYYNYICKLAEGSHDIVLFSEATYQGHVIGSLFGFVTNDRFYFLQQGFLPQYSVFSIGSLLIYKTILALIDKEIHILDFLRGADSYKFNWTKTADEDFYVIIGTSFLGRVALEWLRLQRSIKRNGRLGGIRSRLLGKD